MTVYCVVIIVSSAFCWMANSVSTISVSLVISLTKAPSSAVCSATTDDSEPPVMMMVVLSYELIVESSDLYCSTILVRVVSSSEIAILMFWMIFSSTFIYSIFFLVKSMVCLVCSTPSWASSSLASLTSFSTFDFSILSLVILVSSILVSIWISLVISSLSSSSIVPDSTS